MPPRPDVSDERKDQILTAATAAFARLGFRRARMDDIAEEAGLSKGTLYLYFKSKDALINALLQRIFAREMRQLETAQGDDRPVSERLLALTSGMAAEVDRLAILLPVWFEFYAIAARQRVVRQFFKEYFTTYREALAALVRRGIERGEFRAVDAESVAITLTALFEGLVLLWSVDPSAVQMRPQSEAAVTLLLDGLRQRP